MLEERVVVDTNVFISALISAEGAPSQVLRLCFNGQIIPLMATALYSEFCDVCSRSELFSECILNERERLEFLDDFIGLCEWVSVYYLWRPNLRDEGDNHLIELALAGRAAHIITGNTKDFRKGELLFPDVSIVTSREFIQLKERRH